jgi:hypothetical protein
MKTDNSSLFKYLAAGLAGAIIGGIVVAVATRAIPKIMSGMMHQMRKCMEEGGPDMCREMMERFKSSPQEE